MCEDVNEQRATGIKPAGNPLEQRLVVTHMFEHFY